MEEILMSLKSFHRKKKIIVLSEYVYQDENSTGYFWAKIIDRFGITLGRLIVLAPAPIAIGYLKSAVCGVDYYSFKRSGFNKNKLLSRFLWQLKQTVSFIRLLRRHVCKGDLVLTGTNPVLLLLVLPLLRLMLGFRWVLLVHDVYPNNLVPSGILSNKSLVYRILNRYFNWVYQSADLVFVIGRDMQSLIEKKIESAGRVHYVPSWVDESDIKPLDRNNSEIIKRLGWEDNYIFQFFGNFGRLQGIDNLFKAIQLVQNKRAAFLFIGAGIKAEAVMRFSSSSPKSKVAYLGSFEQSRKQQGLAACDVALITLEKGMIGLGVPSKAYFSMAADRPLLAVMDANSEIAIMIREHNIGWVCEPDDPVALAKLIDEICSNFKSKRLSSVRSVFEQHFSGRVGLDRLVYEVLQFTGDLTDDIHS